MSLQIKKNKPEKLLESALGKNYSLWKDIYGYVHRVYGEAKDEWSYPGEKFGWSFRIKDKKRVIVYLLPRDSFFKTAFVFGEKAYQEVLSSPVNEDIKKKLSAARIYGEGRGIRIKVDSKKIVKDIKSLVDIKINN